MSIIIEGGIRIGGGILIGEDYVPPPNVYIVAEDLATQIVSEPGSGSQNLIEEQ